MKKFIASVLIFLLLSGMAGAVDRTLPRYGGASGAYFTHLETNSISSDTMTMKVNASTTLSTTFTSASLPGIIPVNATSANVTLTLPDAALIKGRMVIVSANSDMGAHYVRIDATGGDKIAGAAKLGSTDAYAGITLFSDGTNYLKAGASGSWTEVFGA